MKIARLATVDRFVNEFITFLAAACIVCLMGGAIVIFSGILLAPSIPESSKNELVRNYAKNSMAIFDLKENFTAMIADIFVVYIEFEDQNTIDLSVYEKTKSGNGKMTCLFREYNIDPYNYRISSTNEIENSEYVPTTKDLEHIKERLGWTDNSFSMIKEYLDRANCISIQNGNPAEVGFARSGVGKYFYHLFEIATPEKDIEIWNDSCTYIYYQPRVVLGYGGGVFGPQCFPD
ncbi:MAG: hypothetical protein AAGF87_06975 [Bacteroidota bacterium]